MPHVASTYAFHMHYSYHMMMIIIILLLDSVMLKAAIFQRVYRTQCNISKIMCRIVPSCVSEKQYSVHNIEKFNRIFIISYK